MTLTISQRRSWARHGDADIQRTVDQARERSAAEGAARAAAAADAYRDRLNKIAELNAALTDEQWEHADLVRTDAGWHEVVRVNAKTVTVKTAHSWTERIDRSKVWRIHRILPAEPA